MKIIRLQAQGFKRIVCADITPGEPLVRVGGNNAEGKSSLLDSIMAALGGAGAAPVKPIHTGQDYAAIRVELGDNEPAIVVEKFFDDAGEKLKITTADGFKATQTNVDAMLGRMTFDPLAFSRLKPADQAAELRRLVPLSVDLDALSREDAADKTARRDVNRDGKTMLARVEAIEVSGIIPERPDRDAISAALASAGEVNGAIEAERLSRDRQRRTFEGYAPHIAAKRDRADALRREADQLTADANRAEQEATEALEALDALPALGEPVDTAKLTADLAQADRDLALLARVDERKRLEGELETLRGRSKSYTDRMAERATLRAKALADAVMPVPGLALARLCDVVPNEEAEDLIVTFEGEPFSQASGAQQLRVSMRLAMAANPKLRIMLIKEGSLLDANGLALVRELAVEGDYQVWLETVGEGDGSGIIMEQGRVRGAEEPERIEPPRRRKTKAVEGVVELPAAEAIERGQAVKINDDGKVEPLVEGRDGLSRTPPAEPAAPPARRKPSDLRKAPAGDLFGGER